MMKKTVKQVVGIDVAQKELVITIGKMYDDFTTEQFGYKVFKNTHSGILALVEWVKKLTDNSVSVRYVM
jgi:hypothetical protein